jgi:neutral ceramidase
MTRLLLLLVSFGILHASRAAPLQIGFAEANITPPVGYRKGGGYTEVVSTGIHDPLKAKAMVLTQGQESFALVMCDLLSVPEVQSRAIRQQFSAASGIPVKNIAAAGTHNHGSPEHCGPLRDILHAKAIREHGRDDRESIDYPALLIQRCVEALNTAHQRRLQGQLRLTITEQRDLAYNRRYLMRDGRVRFNPGKGNAFIVRPAGPVDTDLPLLLAFADGKEAPLGCFTLFAMHTAVFDGMEFGADFPGHLQTALRRHHGADFISIFGEGCAGDTNQVRTFTKDPDPTSEQIGETLARTLIAAEKHLRPLTEPRLTILNETVLAPMKLVSREDFDAAQQRLAEAKADFMDLVASWRICHAWDIQQRHGDKGKPLEVQALRLDSDSALVLLPHEVFVEIGMAIKAASPFRHTMVLSLANDVDYYIPTRRAFEEGSYEVTTCPLLPGCGELLIDTSRKLLNELKLLP